MNFPRPGDVLIRASGPSNYALVDVATHTQIAVAPALNVALEMASDHGGAIWGENVDTRGGMLGAPVLLMPKPTAPLG